jgi:predicted nuclease of predicted toxin-antitoxin system
MRLLLDENLPISLGPLLAERAGWDVVHVRELGLKSAPDTEVLARAELDGRVLVSADTDFGTLLAASAAPGPSVVLLRIGSGRQAEKVARLPIANLPPLTDELSRGAMVVMTDQRIRVRRLPIG